MKGWPRKGDPFHIATDALAGRPTRWQNLGLWDGTEDYEVACAALAERVGVAAGLQPRDRVAELACGSGAAFRVWRERFGVGGDGEMVGVEIDPERADLARENRGRVVVGPALAKERLGLDGVFDAIVIVDAAYHLGSARALARACSSALAPDGRLAFTTLTGPGRTPGWLRAPLGRLAQLEDGALIERADWVTTLNEAGFENPRIEPLDQVLSGFAAHVARRRRLAWRVPGWAKIEMTALIARLGLTTGRLGYTLVSARKP